MEVVVEEDPDGVHNARPELHDQNSQDEKPHGAAQKNRKYEMTDAHFGDCGPERENLEWRRRRKHRREHQTPKGMSLKSRMQLLKALRRDPLAKQFFATFVSDRVNHQTAQR